MDKGKIIEQSYPYIIGVLGFIGSILLLHFFSIPSDKGIQKLLTPVLSLSGVLIGFINATRALIIGMSENQLIKKLKATGGLSVILDYHEVAIRWLFVLLAYTLALIPLDIPINRTILNFIYSLWLSIMFLSFASSFRAVDVFSFLLKASIQR
jgi:hypothetical protein